MNRQRFLQKKPLFLFLTILFSFIGLSWAQAGPKALVELNVNGFIDVGVLDVETKTLKNLTNTPGMHEFPLDWSPDGQMILFSSGDKLDNLKPMVMNTNGTGRRVLDFIPGDSWGASWAPVGGKLALSLEKDGNLDIYTVRLDGSGLQRLTEHPAADGNPIWSPDGRRIAFISIRGNVWQLFVIDASGANPTQLTRDFEEISSFSWSPDGTQLAFRGKREGNFGYFILDAKGQGKPKPLVPPKINGYGALLWLPSGKILYQNASGIFIMDGEAEKDVVKGKNLIPLLENAEGLIVRGWFDPFFARQQAVHPQQKLPVTLGRIKAAL